MRCEVSERSSDSNFANSTPCYLWVQFYAILLKPPIGAFMAFWECLGMGVYSAKIWPSTFYYRDYSSADFFSNLRAILDIFVVPPPPNKSNLYPKVSVIDGKSMKNYPQMKISDICRPTKQLIVPIWETTRIWCIMNVSNIVLSISQDIYWQPFFGTVFRLLMLHWHSQSPANTYTSTARSWSSMTAMQRWLSLIHYNSTMISPTVNYNFLSHVNACMIFY